MKIAIIGTGKVGSVFAQYLKSDVSYVYNRTVEKAVDLAEKIGCLYTDDLEKIISQTDVIFITVSDDAISEIVDEIAKKSLPLMDKIFVHMSGALSSEIFLPLMEKGARGLSIHPLQTFSDTEKALKDIQAAYLSYEGDPCLLNWVYSLGNPILKLNKEQKIKYHLSACIFSNYLVTLMDFGNRMLSDIGIDEGMTAMKPLVDATLSNILLKGTKEALTGPIQRGDKKTIEKHLSVLDTLDLETYKILGEQTSKHLIDEDIRESLKRLWRSHE